MATYVGLPPETLSQYLPDYARRYVDLARTQEAVTGIHDT